MTIARMIVSPKGWDYMEGSTLVQGSCGHEVWLSPSGKAYGEQPDVELDLVCMPCATKDPDLMEHIARKGLHAAPGARDELSEVLGVGAVDQVWAALNVKDVT